MEASYTLLKTEDQEAMQNQSNPSNPCKSGAHTVAKTVCQSDSPRRSLPAFWLGQPAVVSTEHSTLAHAATETVQEPPVTQSSES